MLFRPNLVGWYTADGFGSIVGLANALPPSLAGTKQQLQKILERSDEYLVEARRAVWELRSPSLERIPLKFSRIEPLNLKFVQAIDNNVPTLKVHGEPPFAFAHALGP